MLVQPGITIDELNLELAKIGKEVPSLFPRQSRQSVDVEDAIQRNLICMTSLKDGFFTDQERVARLGLIKGNGDPIQTGGNKVSDTTSFGFNITKLLFGSDYNLGFLYEALIQGQP